MQGRRVGLKMTGRRLAKRGGLSLIEVLIGALIIGVSVLSILEMIRSGTSSLEVTEADAAARQMGADLLRRVCGPRLGPDTGITDAFRLLLGTPARWKDVLAGDPALAQGFPSTGLASLLDAADVRLSLDITPNTHEALGRARGVESVVVTVQFVDRNERLKKVKFARLVQK